VGLGELERWKLDGPREATRLGTGWRGVSHVSSPLSLPFLWYTYTYPNRKGSMNDRIPGPDSMDEGSPIFGEGQPTDRDTRWDGNITALSLRRIRTAVKQTASLVATGGPIFEEPGPNWAASLQERRIFWRPTKPMGGTYSANELLALIGHEAAHINWSGGWDVPPSFDPDKFHRFVNAGEDIRIERLLGLDLPGFPGAKQELYDNAMKHHKDHAEKLSLIDQVGLSYLGIENGAGPVGSEDAKKFAEATWPKVNRICNANSTERMARMLEAIYKELNQAENQDRSPDPSNIPGDCDAGGSDSPSENPERSPIPSKEELEQAKQARQKLERDSIGRLSTKDLLKEMKKGANDQSTKDRIQRLIDREQEAEDQGERAKTMQGGHKPGEEHGNYRPDEMIWDGAVDRMRPNINSLSKRLQATLRTNAESDWEPGQRKGQLDPSQAWRSLTGDMNVFRTPTQIGARDYTFAVTIDRSSSQCDVAEELLDATALICEGIERAGLGLFAIPWDRGPHVHKPFGQPLKEYKGVLGGAVGRPSGGTYEAPALVIAQQALRTVSSGHKILITITDGATSNQPESETVLAELEHEGVRCIGISVNADYDPTHYPRRFNVPSPAELTQLLPRLVNEQVRKGVM
jgi:hypothetical protein